MFRSWLVPPRWIPSRKIGPFRPAPEADSVADPEAGAEAAAAPAFTGAPLGKAALIGFYPRGRGRLESRS
jgi:hypothetical protein